MNRWLNICLLSALTGCWTSRELATAEMTQPLAVGEDERVAACAELAAQLPMVGCLSAQEKATIEAGGPGATSAEQFYNAYCVNAPPVPEVGSPPDPLFCEGSIGSPTGVWVPSFVCRRDIAPLLSCIAKQRSCDPKTNCAAEYLGTSCDPSAGAPALPSDAFLLSCASSPDNMVGISSEPHSYSKDPLYGKYGFAISSCNGHDYRALCTMSSLCDSYDCECQTDGVVTRQGRVVMTADTNVEYAIPKACAWSSSSM